MSTDELSASATGSAAATGATNNEAYDRDILRRQVELLRAAAATRARLENEIVAERDREVAAAKEEAKGGIAATTAKHQQEIEAAKKEYDAVLKRLQSQGAAEQQKIDEQRKTKAAAIDRACDEQSTKIREDSEFEQGSVKEVFKEKRNDPPKLLARAEKDHALWGSQLDEAVGKAKEFLSKCGVKAGAAAEDDSPVPEGDELLLQLKGAHEGAIARTKELLALESSKTIFGGLKKEAAQKALELWTAIERDVLRGKRLLGPAAEWLKVRCGLQSKQMEAKAKQDLVELESRAKKTLADLAVKRDAQAAELEGKYQTATTTIRTKVESGRKEAEEKYPARIAILEAGLVEDIRRRVSAVPGSEAFVRQVALTLGRLMSYKDEYEVARLYTDPKFMQRLREQFSGDFQFSFNLAPPMLPGQDASGRPKKRQFGAWMLTAFRLLAPLKFLRGTPFDVFGYTAERRMERRLVREYQTLIPGIADRLDAANLAAGIELARAAIDIAGYGPIKEGNAAAYEAQLPALKEAFDQATSTPQARAAA